MQKIYTLLHTEGVKMKIRTNILIDKETLRTAQDLGLNVSKTCEDILNLRIHALNQARQQEACFLGPASLPETKKVVGSLGFEPRIANAPGWYPKPC